MRQRQMTQTTQIVDPFCWQPHCHRAAVLWMLLHRQLRQLDRQGSWYALCSAFRLRCTVSAILCCVCMNSSAVFHTKIDNGEKDNLSLLCLALSLLGRHGTQALFSVLSVLPWPLSSSQLDTDKDQHAPNHNEPIRRGSNHCCFESINTCVLSLARNYRHNLLLLRSNDTQISRPHRGRDAEEREADTPTTCWANYFWLDVFLSTPRQ
jgi:hypothetical protein